MPYCTQEDLEKLVPPKELAQLTAESGEEIDELVVNEAIAAADAEIDSYLGVRYQLPLAAPVPARVKALSVDLAAYKLYQRRSLENPARRQAYEDGVNFLKAAAKGLAVIEGAGGLEPAGAAQDVTEISSQDRVFTRETLRDW